MAAGERFLLEREFSIRTAQQDARLRRKSGDIDVIDPAMAGTAGAGIISASVDQKQLMADATVAHHGQDFSQRD